MHPNEISLCFATGTGMWIPTRHYEPLLSEAKRLGYAHVQALGEQVKRQQEGA